MNFTSLLVGDGYLWLLENQTQNLFFEATFQFELSNLEVVSSTSERGNPQNQGECEVKVALRPQESRILRFLLVDPILPWGYKYSYSYKCEELIGSQEELVAIVKAKGALKIIHY